MPPQVNGAAQFGYRLAKGMTARGHDVHVLACRPDNGKSYTEFSSEATLHRLRSHSVPTHEYFRVCLPWEIKKDISLLFDRIKPDVVHVQSHYMIGEHVVYEAKKRGVRIIATNHFMPENLNPFLPFPQWFKNIIGQVSWRDMGKVMGRADVVTTPTPLAAKAMHEHAFLRKVLPLSNGIDAAAYELRARRSHGAAHPYPTVALRGPAGRGKARRRAHRRGRQDPGGLECAPGNRRRRRGQGRAEGPGGTARAHRPGQVLRAWPATRTCARPTSGPTCSVMPGTAELQSLVTLEAMSASTPVVLANAMALPHLVEDGVNGYLFRPNDSDDLAAKITSIMELSPEERAAMGAASRAMVAQPRPQADAGHLRGHFTAAKATRITRFSLKDY